jgi:hypothetical protein
MAVLSTREEGWAKRSRWRGACGCSMGCAAGVEAPKGRLHSLGATLPQPHTVRKPLGRWYPASWADGALAGRSTSWLAGWR